MPRRTILIDLSPRELTLIERYNTQISAGGTGAGARNTARIILRHWLWRYRAWHVDHVAHLVQTGGDEILTNIRLWQARTGEPCEPLDPKNTEKGLQPIHPLPDGPWHQEYSALTIQERADRDRQCAQDGHIVRWYAFIRGVPVEDHALVSNGCARCFDNLHAYTHQAE